MKASLVSAGFHTPLRRVPLSDVPPVPLDPSSRDPRSPYFDAPDSDRWTAVDLKLLHRLPRLVSLNELRAAGGPIAEMTLLKQARLSVQPVAPAAFDAIVALAHAPSAA